MLSHLTLNLTLFLSFGKFSPTKTHAMLNPFFIIEKLCRITFKKKEKIEKHQSDETDVGIQLFHPYPIFCQYYLLSIFVCQQTH